MQLNSYVGICSAAVTVGLCLACNTIPVQAMPGHAKLSPGWLTPGNTAPKPVVVPTQPNSISGISVQAQLDRKQYSAGQPIYLNFVIHTKSVPLLLGSSGADTLNFRFSLRNAAGVELPLTPYGKRMFTPSLLRGSRMIHHLQPGQRRRFQFQLDNLYDLNLSGDYVVRVTYTVSTRLRRNVPLTSGPLTVRVRENAASYSGPVHLSAPETTRSYLYVATSTAYPDRERGGIVRYQIGVDGRLTPALEHTTLTDKGCRTLLFTPDKRFAFAASSIDGSTVSSFRVGPNGTLTLLSASLPASAGWFSGLALSPDNRLLYAMSNTSQARHKTFGISGDGTLTPVLEAPETKPAAPEQATLGQKVALKPATDEDIIPFKTQPSPYFMFSNAKAYFLARPNASPLQLKFDGTSGDPLQGQVIHPNGRHAYMLTSRDIPNPGRKSNDFMKFIIPSSIAPDGTVMPLSTGISAGATPEAKPYSVSLVMNPAGNVLYALDRTSGQIGQFRIMRDGNLQRMAPVAGRTGGHPTTMTFDPTGRFAYVFVGYYGSIAQYRIQPDGSLHPLGLDIGAIGYAEGEMKAISLPYVPQWGEQAGGLQLSIRTERERTISTEPAPLSIVLKNTSNKRILIGNTADDMARFNIEMLGCNDEVRPLSPYGQMLLRPRTGGKGKPLWLKSGESRQYRVLLNRLNDRMVESNPYKCEHDYASVQVRRRLGEDKAPVVVSSNVLRYGGSSQLGHLNTYFTHALPPQYHYATGIGQPFGE